MQEQTKVVNVQGWPSINLTTDGAEPFLTMSSGDDFSTYLSPVEAHALRDALIELYPLDTPSTNGSTPPAPEYRVREDGSDWLVERVEHVVREQRVHVARVYTLDNARRIAQALNETHGL